MNSANKQTKRNLLIAGLIIAAIGGYFLFRKLTGSVDVEKRYSSNIVMIHHSYLYKVWFSDSAIGEIKFIKAEDGNFIPFDEEKMAPNELLAVGLIIHENGACITSSKALYPWTDQNDNEALRKTAEEICDYQRSLGNDIYFELTGGESVSLEMISGLGKDRQKMKRTDCQTLESSEALEQGIAFLKPNMYAIPYDYADIDLSGVKDGLNEGTSVSLLAINDETFDGQAEPVVLQKGKISNKVVSSNIWFDFENKHIAEGAPVFDKKGRLIAINTVLTDGVATQLLGKRVAITEGIDAIVKRNFQSDINGTLRLLDMVKDMDKPIADIEKTQASLDSLMQRMDTIGQSFFQSQINIDFKDEQ